MNADQRSMTSSRKGLHAQCSEPTVTPAAVALRLHQRGLFLPYGDHPLPVLVLLFVYINVRSCHILDGCDVAASPAHDPRHDRGRNRQLL